MNKSLMKILIRNIKSKLDNDQEMIDVFESKISAMRSRQEDTRGELDELIKELDK